MYIPLPTQYNTNTNRHMGMAFSNFMQQMPMVGPPPQNNFLQDQFMSYAQKLIEAANIASGLPTFNNPTAPHSASAAAAAAAAQAFLDPTNVPLRGVGGSANSPFECVKHESSSNINHHKNQWNDVMKASSHNPSFLQKLAVENPFSLSLSVSCFSLFPLAF